MRKFFMVYGVGAYIAMAIKQFARRWDRADNEGKPFHIILELIYCIFWIPACILGLLVLGLQTAIEANTANKADDDDDIEEG